MLNSMNKIDALVRQNILAFPLIMRNRFDVLHHILCVIGNGYEWVNGEAVIEGDPNEYQPWTPEKEYARNTRDLDYLDEREMPDEIKTLLKKSYTETAERMIAECEPIVAEIDTRMYDMAIANSSTDDAHYPNGESIYPQSHYAMLMNVPESLDPEWAEAVAQMREIAIQHGWVF